MPKNLRNPSIRIRVQDEDNRLASSAALGRAVGWAKMKVIQLNRALWRQDPDRTHLPARTYHYAMPGSGIFMIEIKTSPSAGMWLVRIVGGTLPAGILSFPRNVDDEFGWIAPFEDPDAVPPVTLPGTPLLSEGFGFPFSQDKNRGVFRRQGGKIKYIRDQDFRQFRNGALVDWRSLPTESTLTGEPDFEILHWHAPNRYLPQANTPNPGLGDITTASFESFFYDRSGTITVSGPGAVIRGVAIRNLLDDTKETEYICITGFHDSGGYKVHAMSRADPAVLTGDPAVWRLLGTVGPFPELGVGVVKALGNIFSVSDDLKWDVPIHFNRIGTKACQINMTRTSVQPAVETGVPFLLEISIDDEDVITATNTNVTTQALSTNIRRKTTTTETDNDAVDSLPECASGGAADFVERTTTITDAKVVRDTTQNNCPLAADYKIDTDDEIGFITTTIRTGLRFPDFDTLSGIIESSSQGSTTLTKTSTNACKIPNFPPLGPSLGFNEPPIVTGEEVGAFTHKDHRDSTVSIKMDGGRNQVTVGPLSIGIDNNNSNTIITESRLIFVEQSPPGADETLTTQGVAQSTPLDQLQIGGSTTQDMVALEIKFADIRYGSMIIKHRMLRPTGFFFNTTTDREDVLPFSGTLGARKGLIPTREAPQDVGSVIGAPSGLQPSDVKSQMIITTESSGESFNSWGAQAEFLNKTIVVAQGVNEQFEAIQGPFARAVTLDLFQAGPIFTRGLTSFALGQPEGIDEDLSSSDSNPRNLIFDNSKTIPTSLTLGTEVAVHDRLGGLFYIVDLPDADLSGGAGVEPNWNYTAYFAYAGIDPTVSVGQPPNEQNGAQGSLANTTRPLFGPLAAVQNATIPPVVP